jgi:hypothetical protein
MKCKEEILKILSDRRLNRSKRKFFHATHCCMAMKGGKMQFAP